MGVMFPINVLRKSEGTFYKFCLKHISKQGVCVVSLILKCGNGTNVVFCSEKLSHFDRWFVVLRRKRSKRYKCTFVRYNMFSKTVAR